MSDTSTQSSRGMKTVVVSAFNYAGFLPACLDGVLAQTEKRFTCIVIDDGSSDGTATVAEAYARRDDRIRVISKPNEGQLSVFNLAADLCGDDDQVFFLDADDVWSPRYLEAVGAAWAGPLQRCDFVFSGCRQDGPDFDHPAIGAGSPPVDLGLSSGVTRAFLCWIGNVTSTLAMHGRLLKRILPYPFFREWRVRADDLLIMGASIAGARKGFVGPDLVYYRQHEQNNFAGKPADNGAEHARILGLERYVTWLCAREFLQRIPSPLLVERELENFRAWHPHNLAPCRPRSALAIQQWPWWRRFTISNRIRRGLREAAR